MRCTLALPFVKGVSKKNTRFSFFLVGTYRSPVCQTGMVRLRQFAFA